MGEFLRRISPPPGYPTSTTYMQQRQFKFRAWGRDTKTYAPVPMSIEGWMNLAGELGLTHFDKSLHYDWEQFTGLLDKNGKEIYEGDIVENTTDIYREDEHDGRVPTGATQTSRAVVAWDAHWALFRVARDIERGRLEVIGNIHENPDLIESGNTTKEE